ncbi:unnamed protein product [Amoebophrya sp. A25]|nr:unnamed protein product [Amoebophrya sp. A25]|eukprot:GSA25T00000582001.1
MKSMHRQLSMLRLRSNVAPTIASTSSTRLRIFVSASTRSASSSTTSDECSDTTDGDLHENKKSPGVADAGKPSAYQMAILRGDVEKAAEEAMKSPQGLPFAANQCTQRALLLYTSAREEREAAITTAQTGLHFREQFELLSEQCRNDKEAMRTLLLQPTLWAPVCQQEFVRLDTSLKLARAACYMRGYWNSEERKLDDSMSGNKSQDEACLPPSAMEYQVIGKAVVGRLLTGRIASVLQCFMGMRLSQQFHPKVFDIHVRAARNFEETIAPPGPKGPLDAEGSSDASPTTSWTTTDAEFDKWMRDREEGVAKQLKLVSELVAEITLQMLPREEGKMLLHAAREFFNNECQDPETVKRCLKTFESTNDMI